MRGVDVFLLRLKERSELSENEGSVGNVCMLLAADVARWVGRADWRPPLGPLCWEKGKGPRRPEIFVTRWPNCVMACAHPFSRPPSGSPCGDFLRCARPRRGGATMRA